MSLPQHNLAAIHEAVASRIPDRECIVFRDRRLSYATVAERTRRLANALAARGLGAQPARGERPGHESHADHLAIYAYNGNEYLEAMLGAFKARVAPVNINYRYVADELRHVLADSQARAVAYHSAFAPTLAAVLPHLPHLRVLLQIDDGSGQALLPGAEWYENVLAESSPEPPACAAHWSPDDLYILYTGGTTGMPKGVLWRQADIHRTAMGGRDPLSREPWPTIDAIATAAAGPRQHVVLPLPPFMHGAGHWLALSALNQGSTIVVQDEVTRLDPAGVCDLIERERVTYLQFVGDAFAQPVLTEAEAGRHDVRSVRIVLSGGAPLSTGVKQRLLALVPDLTVVDGLGSSEGGGQGMQVTTAGSGRDGAAHGSFSPTEGSIVLSADRTRLLLPGDDEVGWLAKRGDIPLGYLGDAARTAQTFPIIDGERLSVPGDRARVLADGTIALLGRDSTTINSGGEKVYAEEVEAAIRHHPDVADVVIAPRPSERWGQEVVAIVQRRDGCTTTAAAIEVEAGRHIARYKLPKAWIFVDAVVRSPAGKADHRWAVACAAEAT